MAPSSSLVKKDIVKYTRINVDVSQTTPQISAPWEELHAESRATRLVGDSTRFLLISFVQPERRESSVKLLDAAPRVKVQTWLNKHSEETLVIGKRSYRYLGFTESQLKESKIMFFHEDAKWTASTLRAHFGDLMPVYEKSGAGKWAARLGLSFSSTAAFGYVEPGRVAEIPDIQAFDGSVCTDGCGLIRESLALRVCQEMSLPEDTCVFQIRLAGIKGVLTKMPDNIFECICGQAGVLKPAAIDIAYRPSMKKYNGGPSILEIQNVSQSPRYSGARLNKNFILILMARGIPLDTFKTLLKAQVDALAAILHDREAAKFFVDGELDSMGEGFDQQLYEMLLAGQDMDEPQVQIRLRRCQKRYFDKLRKKLSITVKDSAYLFGVADPLGLLKEGEVYVNLPSRGGSQVGEVVVGRNPAYATSDLRVLNGVNVKELSHLTNCIVFSSKSKHSETDYMGGGDLDGDMYMVITDKKLIPVQSRGSRVEPISRAASSTSVLPASTSLSNNGPKTRRHASELEEKLKADSISLFLEFFDDHLLGELANRWLDEAQSTSELADSAICCSLRELVERALDMTKAGSRPGELRPRYLSISQLDLSWISPLEELAAMVPDDPASPQKDFTCDPDLIYQSRVAPEIWEDAVQKARALLPQYNRGLARAINLDDGAKSKEKIPLSTKRNMGETYSDSFKKQITEEYFPATGDLFELGRQVILGSACYVVGYAAKKEAFAWVGVRSLNFLKSFTTSGGRIPLSVGSSRPQVGPLPSVNTANYGQIRHPYAQCPPTGASKAAPTSSKTPASNLQHRGDPRHLFCTTRDYTHSDDDSDSSSVHSSDFSDALEPSIDIAPGDSVSRESTEIGSFANTLESPSAYDLASRLHRMGIDGKDDIAAIRSRGGQLNLVLDSDQCLSIRVSRRKPNDEGARSIISSDPPSACSTVTTGADRSKRTPGLKQEMPTPSFGSATKGISVMTSRSNVSGSPAEKPKEPVATNETACASGGCHSWLVSHANAHVRRYTCNKCRILVKEKRDPTSVSGWRALDA